MSKSRSMSIEQRIQDTLKKFFTKDAFFIMGISGGVDSMVLMYMMHRLQVNALVVHLNYGLRGEDSDLDQELVEGMAIEWGFDCQSFKVRFDQSSEQNVQKWARDQRYAIFRDLKEAYNADAIVTAHHQDDQVETILQKLFRGSSPTTWKGMEIFNNEIYRPFIEFSKEEIRACADAQAVPFREDISNAESKYARNFLRNEFNDKLDSFFPGWQQNILALTQYGGIVDSVLKEIAGRVLAEKGKISLSALLQIDDELHQALLKTIIQSETGVSLSRGKLEKILLLIQAQTGKSLDISQAYAISIDREYAIIHKKGDDDFDVVELDYGDVESGYDIGSIRVGFTETVTPDMLYMDANDLAYPLTIRKWQEGDKFSPFGMDGRQKVSDHLTNRKISTIHRKKTLVLCGADDTIYAIIFSDEVEDRQIGTISNKVACDDLTRQYLVIQKETIL